MSEGMIVMAERLSDSEKRNPHFSRKKAARRASCEASL
jgi:hypothetical protein